MLMGLMSLMMKMFGCSETRLLSFFSFLCKWEHRRHSHIRSLMFSFQRSVIVLLVRTDAVLQLERF